MFNSLVFIGILCYFVTFSIADIIRYQDHAIYPDKPEYLLVPKFTKKDVPSWKPGKGQSYIDLTQLSLQVDCSDADDQDKCNDSEVDFEILMFEVPLEKEWYDYWSNNAFCCNDDELKKGQ